MVAAVSIFSERPRADAILPGMIRAAGNIRCRFTANPRRTEASELYEAGGYRMKFPKGPLCEGVIINTGGGMAGGDALNVDISLDAYAKAVVSTQSAEKIYRAQREASSAAVHLALAEGSQLAWLPQQTLLFSGAKLNRRFRVDMASDSELTLFEGVIFGRGAMGERITEGAFRDSWRIRRGEKLVFADEIAIEGDMAARLDRPAIGAGARSIATFLHLAPDAEARLDEARSALETCLCECGASAWNGMLIVRFASIDPEALRQSATRFLNQFRAVPVPRVWQC
jgi:urease accessory protein